MKVLIDIDALAPPLTGIGHYTLNLVHGLQSTHQIGDLKFLKGGCVIEADQLQIKSEPDRGRQVARKLPFRPLLRWGYLKYSNARFLMQSHALSEFVYHAPNYILMPFRGRSVVTIHDLSFLRHPEFHPADRVRFWSKQIHKVAERATHIITDSEFQRQEILSLLDVSEDKVSTIHLGVADHFRDYSQDECSSVLKKHGLGYKQFSLVVATIEPRKNFDRIVKAFEALPAEVRKAFPLVIVGDKGWLSEDIHSAIERLVGQNEAYRLGYVSDDDLCLLYAAAAVFVYPSLYEGFGLPVLEAMASGTAVLSSNSSSIPEVAGDTCSLVDPESLEQLIHAWRVLLTDEIVRHNHAFIGKERAKMFSWEQCVTETLDVYKKLAGT